MRRLGYVPQSLGDLCRVPVEYCYLPRLQPAGEPEIEFASELGGTVMKGR